jgi:hypothetical protein
MLDSAAEALLARHVDWAGLDAAVGVSRIAAEIAEALPQIAWPRKLGLLERSALDIRGYDTVAPRMR